jgi:hypothetical protein
MGFYKVSSFVFAFDQKGARREGCCLDLVVEFQACEVGLPLIDNVSVEREMHIQSGIFSGVNVELFCN